MRYLPKSPTDRTEMLQEIGVDSIDDLFATIPAEYQLKRDLDVPRQHAESEIVDAFRAYAIRNATGYTSFLGAGCYRHYRPVAIDTIVSRGEFLTSYTPYQPEIAQGTLQAMFEFQTMICELTGMEIANASMYDGSTGAARGHHDGGARDGAQRCGDCAHGASGVSRGDPHPTRSISRFRRPRWSMCGIRGGVDLAALDAAITSDTACVLIQSPNFFGTVEDVAAIAEIAHAKGALLIVSIAEAISLGVVKPPAEADIVSLEAQSFGVALSYGGPYCGVMACKEKFLRQMPGRLVGETKDIDGKRGFVLTLSTREQHIRREKATSNICTNQALVAMMVTVYLSVYGKEGLRELGEHNLAKAHFLAETLAGAHGAKQLFAGAPFFNEFVIELPESAEQVNAALLEEENHRRPGAGAVVSGAGTECDAVVRDRADDARADGRGGGAGCGGGKADGDGVVLLVRRRGNGGIER